MSVSAPSLSIHGEDHSIIEGDENTLPSDWVPSVELRPAGTVCSISGGNGDPDEVSLSALLCAVKCAALIDAGPAKRRCIRELYVADDGSPPASPVVQGSKWKGKGKGKRSATK